MAANSFTSVLHPLTQTFKHQTLIKPQKRLVSKPATTVNITTSKLRVAVIGGGPAGSSAAKSLASGGIETYIFERSPEAAKPCGGAIPLCMLDEFSIPTHLIDRKVTQMKIISPSNLTVDFGKTLKPHEFISMVRREVLDDFLRARAEECGAILIKALVKNIEIPISEISPYIIHYISNNTHKSLAVDVVIGADGANSKVAKSIKAGNYNCAIAFQERIKLPEDKMKYYENLAEMYVGDDVSPDFYGWVFPKCDHVAVGTGTVRSRQNIKHLQGAIRNRVRCKIDGGEIIKVEAHPIPEHPRPTRVRGRVALVGDAAGYVTKCSGEGIYFAAKSGRMCGEGIVRASENGVKMIGEMDLRREYLRRWDDEYLETFKFLDVLQRVFYGSNAGREALVELCGKEYVQRMTFESYLYKRLAKGTPVEDLRMAVDTIGSFIRCSLLGSERRRRLLEL
ncbi:Geranylgeranyl diphosphate reductase-chloroplastic [Striga hermonthica]|uniref:Geranylgeranyl diphosphate reductase, chloroplastic n=1 Tax=Striga hermonthica TaxID=68872 RepID=A0A9N7NTK9_STRHE|nr:Geranylgeranyl diphosphate reductase-chloroplastic [Striga hermonthica]